MKQLLSDYDDLSPVRFKSLLLTMRGENGTDKNYKALRHEVLQENHNHSKYISTWKVYKCSFDFSNVYFSR